MSRAVILFLAVVFLCSWDNSAHAVNCDVPELRALTYSENNPTKLNHKVKDWMRVNVADCDYSQIVLIHNNYQWFGTALDMEIESTIQRQYEIRYREWLVEQERKSANKK
jgi:hypothetical protein